MSRRDHPASRGHLLMLVVDDSLGDRQLLRAALRHHPIDVLGVDSGVEGIEAAIHHQPDVILLDWHMPGFDGRAVIETLKIRPETAQIPIIVLTADSLVCTEAMRAGAYQCLLKPHTTAELGEMVLAACGL